MFDGEDAEAAGGTMLETGGMPQFGDYDPDQPRYIEDGAEDVVALQTGAPRALLGTAAGGELRHLQGIGEGRGRRLEAGKRADGEWDWQALRRGVRDERGDMAFYEASFVEDPWRGLRGDGAARGHGGGVTNLT